MNNSDQEKQDQRTNAGMEDNNAMTIEFLRARLLTERSVSKSARQRANDLEKRVAELEEQLRIVSLQRMKAEKATADVLAILESNGFSDVSEMYDSLSDQDTPCEAKVGNKLSKEEKNSVNTKIREDESDELSVSDLDFSPVSGRSLSWKGRKDSPRPIEKHRDPPSRRRSSFTSTYSSPKARTGKSCRQIRHKESRSVVEEPKTNPIKVDTSKNGLTTMENIPHGSDVGPDMPGVVETMKEETLLRGCLEHEQNLSTNLDYDANGGDRDMEKALEHQAQLIGQYVEMERAQREWEEKFRENNSSTPDSCDPGNRSDVTEEGYEIKSRELHPTGTIAFQTCGTKPEIQDLSKVWPNDVIPPSHVDMTCAQDQKSSSTPASESAGTPASESAGTPASECAGTPASESVTRGFEFPMAREKQNQESLGKDHHSPEHSSYNHLHSHGVHNSPGSLSTPMSTRNSDSGFENRTSSGSQNELYALVPHKPPDEVGGVLEALKQAKQSLQHKINRFPLPGGGLGGRAANSSAPTTFCGVKEDIPVGSDGLFRLPTDFSTGGNTRADFLNSNALLGNYYPDITVPPAARNPFVTSPYLENRSGISSDGRFVTSGYLERGSRISTQKRLFDSSLENGLPSSSMYSYPTYPIVPSYPDPILHVPSRQGLSSPVPSKKF